MNVTPQTDAPATLALVTLMRLMVIVRVKAKMRLRTTTNVKIRTRSISILSMFLTDFSLLQVLITSCGKKISQGASAAGRAWRIARNRTRWGPGLVRIF
jgi:hypothetical protein